MLVPPVNVAALVRYLLAVTGTEHVCPPVMRARTARVLVEQGRCSGADAVLAIETIRLASWLDRHPTDLTPADLERAVKERPWRTVEWAIEGDTLLGLPGRLRVPSAGWTFPPPGPQVALFGAPT